MNRALLIQFWKEMRALLPVWLAGALALVVPRYMLPIDLTLLVAAYAIAAIAIGATAVGHEFTAGTLVGLLAQPVSRRRLAAQKIAAVVAALALLGWVAADTLFARTWIGQAAQLRPYRTDIWLMPLAGALFIAPWTTILCRSALAGVTFTLAIPAVLWIASGIVVSHVFDFTSQALAVEAIDAFRVALLRALWLAVCAAGAVFGWGAFRRLEVRERVGGDLNFPLWSRSREGLVHVRPRPSVAHRLWLLAGKELRIQQLAFAIGGVYIVSIMLIKLLVNGDLAPSTMAAVTGLYGAIAAVLTCSLAIATERQMRTLETQILLPVPVRLQWAIKFGVVVFVTLALAVGLPHAVAAIAGIGLPGKNEYVVILTLAVASLYVSSVSTSSLRALLWAIPLWLVVVGLTEFLARRFSHSTQWVAGPMIDRMGVAIVASWSTRSWMQFESMLMQATGAVALVVALLFAARNFRTSDRTARRVVTQVVIVLMILSAGLGARDSLDESWFKAYRAYWTAHPLKSVR